ncbi:flavodoxin family protein [Acidaminobacter sp. JC074]|uniref:flavodoxin family protein n=1 Tax=Acidaminobacter sp. JC074 TaxID=2530199 RepID=UPI001F0DB414|nr:flavodoxin family protein [Acidaminobacter sp. JC074]MCH4886879.1 flavodoxin family protein [Acidaminobacter sp. JC074]
MSKVAIVFGSPRKNSNTHILVDEAIKGLNEKGVDHEILYLNDLNIKGCQACYYCKRNDTTKCVIDDDMQKVYKAMEESDGLIVAAPIYFCEVSAQTRLFVDRLFPYYDMHLQSAFPQGKALSFIITQNQPNKTLFERHINDFKMVVGMLGYERKEDLLVENVDKGYKPMVTERPDMMDKAYKIGLELLN